MTEYSFKQKAKEMKDQLVAWRRDFHRHPELAFEENRSAGIIADRLREWGYEVETGVGQTGVVGLLKGVEEGPTVMARFDMDALPIQEENDVPYVSENEGKMHACGHDAHMAMGLGVASAMAELQDEMKGTVKLIFQPAEEGGNGAVAMIEDGVMETPRPDVFLSTHVWNTMHVGRIGVTKGPAMAAAEKWSCVITGEGGHGALPNQTVDPIVAAAQTITGLQSVVSRNVSPLKTAVVSVGSVHAGDAFNVIPPRVEMTGTIRTYEPKVRETVLRRVRDIIKGTAEAFGASAELELESMTPAVINDAEVSDVVQGAAAAVVGEENVVPDEQTMGSEDAAFFMQDVPGCYFFLGSSNPEKEIGCAHHNPRFDIDEEALPLGVATMLNAIAHYLLS